MLHRKSLLAACLFLSLGACSQGAEYWNPDYQYVNGDERYKNYGENPFVNAAENPVSTFSVDADGASFSNVRRMLNDGHFPGDGAEGAVRTEEFLNYFTFNYPEPPENVAVAVNGEVSQCPWKEDHKLIRIGLKGKSIPKEALPPSNLVFLIDVSGSMKGAEKLDLVRASLREYVNQMSAEDRIAIVTYAGVADVSLPSTSGRNKAKIIDVLNQLKARGVTHGSEGINAAYEIAQESFLEGGNNRVFIATDGDFNVGLESEEELVQLITHKRKTGIYLTVLGVGEGNLYEAALEQMANHGNGHFEYLDNLEQGMKVMLHDFGKFYTVAEDVKVQVEFNPDYVSQYRLIGYENRLLRDDQFEDDRTDAAEIGAGQTITALYQVIPVADSLVTEKEVFNVDFRYKEPGQTISNKLELTINDQGKTFEEASENMRFSAAVAGFSLLLRRSEYSYDLRYENVWEWADSAKTFDPHGYRAKFIPMIEQASSMDYYY